MLGNVYINKVYINKIHARQCLYACLFCREGIVPKRVSTPLLLGSPHFLKSLISPPYRQICHLKFSLLAEI